MLAKMINENEIEELNPDYIVIDGVVYTNPQSNPNIDLEALGYKQLVINDIPEYDAETQKAVRYYYNSKDAIHRGWRIYSLSKEELELREQIKSY